MKILIDVDDLERKGVLAPELAATLRASAGRDVGTTAINLVLAFGAVAVAAGLLTLVQSAQLAAALSLAFLVGGYFVRASSPHWSKLGNIWMVVGALTLAFSIGALIDRPLAAALIAAAIFVSVALLAESHLLMAAAALALGAAVGGSTGYWHACYEIAVREPTLTIVLFSALGLAAWRIALASPTPFSNLALTFARVSVVLVNFGFWVGSLWGDTPGQLWARSESSEWSPPQIPEIAFAAVWALAILGAGFWGARNGRRFMVNAAATFGAIDFYTQWFERLGVDPVAVIGGGLVAIGAGYAIWRYNAGTPPPGHTGLDPRTVGQGRREGLAP